MTDASVRLPAVAGRPAAAYFTLHGGRADTALVTVRTKAARAELHETTAAGMRPIANVPLPAGGTLRFAPGGRHVMLFGLDPALTRGQRVTLYARLADGREASAVANVVGPADPPPGR